MFEKNTKQQTRRFVAILSMDKVLSQRSVSPTVKGDRRGAQLEYPTPWTILMLTRLKMYKDLNHIFGCTDTPNHRMAPPNKANGAIRVHYSYVKPNIRGTVLGPLLYLVYSADIPTQTSTHMATFADDICILSSHSDPNSVSFSLQNHLNRPELWCKQWRIKINQSKSVHVTFSLRRQECPPITLDNVPIPPANHFLKLTMDLDCGFATQNEDLPNKPRIADRWSARPQQRSTNSLGVMTFHN
ncbi:hypothetical protein AAG570_012405 [Ranatra chinensis]|uniref:Reverse transcriptase domain-containing protein n=1 Tax=Ranatra chinensis TaxID=642074 RepID=A0ABD0YJ33_9HEMI